MYDTDGFLDNDRFQCLMQPLVDQVLLVNARLYVTLSRNSVTKMQPVSNINKILEYFVIRQWHTEFSKGPKGKFKSRFHGGRTLGFTVYAWPNVCDI